MVMVIGFGGGGRVARGVGRGFCAAAAAQGDECNDGFGGSHAE
jgi:hypothetical protein